MNRSARAAAISVLSATGAFLIVDTCVRLTTLVWPGISLFGLLSLTKYSVFDFLVISALASICLVLIYLWRRRPNLVTLLARVFLAFSFGLVILACINVQAIQIIGGPLTYQWLYYADLLNSFTSQFAVRAAINDKFALLLVVAVLGFALIYAIFRTILDRALAKGRLSLMLGIAAPIVAGLLVLSYDRAQVSEGERALAANPLVEIVRSALAGDTSDLLRDPDAIPPAKLPPPTNDPSLLPAGLDDGKVKNVVVIVLESIGAHYVPGTGGPITEQLMPNLNRYRGQSLAFTNAYSHVAYSTKALFSLLTGRVPEFSFNTETYKFRNAPLTTMSSRLKEQGYRTAFFMSGDFKFQAADRFLLNRGFDQLSDMETITCQTTVNRGSTADWPNLDSIDDHCTARALIRWIAHQDGQSFFAIFWTGNTHWPYFPKPEPRDGQYSPDPMLNRYLAALRATDAAVGLVLDELSRRDMLQNTLVVVVGDHGEAFNQHDYSVHGSTIFEEQMRIPLLLIGGKLNGGTSTVLAALSDVAPTVLHVLGYPPDQSWDGRSLFDPNRPQRIMLFAPNQDMVVGFREGNRKYVYQLARGRHAVFDLSADPGETRNVADSRSATYTRRHVAGWMQEQSRRLKAISPAQ